MQWLIRLTEMFDCDILVIWPWEDDVLKCNGTNYLKKENSIYVHGREIPGSSFKMQVTTDSFTDALPGSVLRGKHICAGQSLVHAMYLRVK